MILLTILDNISTVIGSFRLHGFASLRWSPASVAHTSEELKIGWWAASCCTHATAFTASSTVTFDLVDSHRCCRSEAHPQERPWLRHAGLSTPSNAGMHASTWPWYCLHSSEARYRGGFCKALQFAILYRMQRLPNSSRQNICARGKLGICWQLKHNNTNSRLCTHHYPHLAQQVCTYITFPSRHQHQSLLCAPLKDNTHATFQSQNSSAPLEQTPHLLLYTHLSTTVGATSYLLLL